MRTLIISGGVEGIQRIEFDDKNASLMFRAISLDVEAHNSLNTVENRWVWGEEGTESDPTLAKPEE